MYYKTMKIESIVSYCVKVNDPSLNHLDRSPRNIYIYIFFFAKMLKLCCGCLWPQKKGSL